MFYIARFFWSTFTIFHHVCCSQPYPYLCSNAIATMFYFQIVLQDAAVSWLAMTL